MDGILATTYLSLAMLEATFFCIRTKIFLLHFAEIILNHP